MFKRRRERKASRLYITLKNLLGSNITTEESEYEKKTLPNGLTIIRRIKPVEQMNTIPDETTFKILCSDGKGGHFWKEIPTQ